jgi:hypothetical protein
MAARQGALPREDHRTASALLDVATAPSSTVAMDRRASARPPIPRA